MSFAQAVAPQSVPSRTMTGGPGATQPSPALRTHTAPPSSSTMYGTGQNETAFLSLAQFRAHSEETRSELRILKEMFYSIQQQLGMSTQVPA